MGDFLATPLLMPLGCHTQISTFRHHQSSRQSMSASLACRKVEPIIITSSNGTVYSNSEVIKVSPLKDLSELSLSPKGGNVIFHVPIVLKMHESQESTATLNITESNNDTIVRSIVFDITTYPFPPQRTFHLKGKEGSSLCTQIIAEDIDQNTPYLIKAKSNLTTPNAQIVCDIDQNVGNMKCKNNKICQQSKFELLLYSDPFYSQVKYCWTFTMNSFEALTLVGIASKRSEYKLLIKGFTGVKRIYSNSDVIRVVSDKEQSNIVDLDANNEVVLAYECRNPGKFIASGFPS